MLLSLIRSGNIESALMNILASCIVVFLCCPIHEYSHALVAYMLGDNTAKNQGRLTVNPIKHLNPIGTLMIFLFGFGYAQPVPINIRNFKNKKLGTALTAVAGPISNLVMGSIFVTILCVVVRYMPSVTIKEYVKLFLYYATIINISLAAFNLIPIPPLDGSKILASILPNKIYMKYMMYERYIMIALMLLLFTGVLSTPISYLTNLLFKIVSAIPSALFKVSFYG